MSLLKCTKKLQKEMGVKKSDLFEENEDALYLGSWHVNLININRKKSLLFVNDKTLFNFVIPDVLKAQIRNLSEIFKDYLLCVLAEEDIPKHVRYEIMFEYKFVRYGNTNNKRGFNL